MVYVDRSAVRCSPWKREGRPRLVGLRGEAAYAVHRDQDVEAIVQRFYD